MDAYPPSPYPCQSVLEFRLDAGETLDGPFYSVIVPDRIVSLQVEKGMTLRGPIFMRLCDGKLYITKP